MKAFVENKINMTEKLKLDLERVENIVGKRENTGHHNRCGSNDEICF